MRYHLWDTDINKLLGVFAAEEEALALVRALVSRSGEAVAQDLSLGHDGEDGARPEPISGTALLARANESARTREPVAVGAGSSAGDAVDRAAPIPASSRRGGRR